MTDMLPPLTPMPLDILLGRVANEWESRQRIFDLMKARVFRNGDGPDLSTEFLGRPIATPLGPAAGPHSQLAENIVLGYMAGARIFELKTVQILDELEIARPCIDAQTIGYNIEWSQELLVPQSLEEYVKAWMMIDILKKWEPTAELLGPVPGPHVFDMSVGYDLDGIRSEKVTGFINGLKDASRHIDALRPSIPEPFAKYRDMAFSNTISDTVTLSTFHGCPPDEIERITKYLLNECELDVIVKLNPTLLGENKVREILHDQLGYTDLRLIPQSFVDDLQFDRAVELISELRGFAEGLGRKFGIKLTNTMIVENHKQWMPEEQMYMSGPPLHALAISLLGELTKAMPKVLAVGNEGGDTQVSFSAGITKMNIADSVGLGLSPTTLCTDLLKPGGYGRIAPMLKQLVKDMDTVGAASLPDLIAQRSAAATEAGHESSITAHIADIFDPTVGEYYQAEFQAKLPKAIDNELQMWGCVACNFCVTVCPNDAVTRIATIDSLKDEIDGRQQYFILSELCNECGNCMTFCPELGDPAIVKPRLVTTQEKFDNTDGQVFLLERSDGDLSVTAKPGFEEHVGRLSALLKSDQGLPIRLDTIPSDAP